MAGDIAPVDSKVNRLLGPPCLPVEGKVRAPMARLDPHSYNDDTQPETESLTWKARVDFHTRRLHAEATLTLKEASAGPLDLDTRELDIRAVVDEQGRPLPFLVSPPEPILGSRLRVELSPGTKQLTVRYRTSPQASALQWLTPAQTAGGQYPYLFSQCQAIHARSVVPLQDTPRIRIRYRAELTVPKALKAVMASGLRRPRGAGRGGGGALRDAAAHSPLPAGLRGGAAGGEGAGAALARVGRARGAGGRRRGVRGRGRHAARGGDALRAL